MISVNYWPHTGHEYERFESYRAKSLILAVAHAFFRRAQGWQLITVGIERPCAPTATTAATGATRPTSIPAHRAAAQKTNPTSQP